MSRHPAQTGRLRKAGGAETPIPKALLVLLALTLWQASLAAEPPPVYWRPAARGLLLADWRSRIALRPELPGEVFVGGTLFEARSEGALLFRNGGPFDALAGFPPRVERTFVLALGPDGVLWVAPFRPNEDETYTGLEIWRHAGGRFRRERVRPGIWPQAMQMFSADEGYVAGNHGRILHRKDGRWRREDLEGGAGRWYDHNFLAMRLGPDGGGWAAGVPGLLARREPGGRFRPVPVPPELATSIFAALDVDPAGRLFLATQAGEIARFDGAAWRIDKVADGGLLGIDLISADDGWAVGVRGILLRWNGATWRRQASPTTANLFDVAMASPERGYIAGAGCLLEAAPQPPLFEESEDRARFPLLDRPAFLAAGDDLDRDGDLDLVLASADGAFLFVNLGDRFAEGRHLPFAAPASAHLQDLAIGESNGDGRPDLLAIFAPPALSLLEQLPGGGLAERSARAGLAGLSPGLRSSNAFADLDGDGDLDLYLQRGVDPGGRPLDDLVLLNDGAGRFAPWPARLGGDAVETFALLGDLDRDTRPDLLLAGAGGAETRLFAGAAGAPLGPAPLGRLATLPAGAYQQGHLADLDRDGRPDLLLFGERGLLFPGDGAGGFGPPREPFAPTAPVNRQGPQLGAVADLDLDGDAEVLVMRHQGERSALRLERRDANGRYADVAAEWGLADLQGEAILPADLDGDGDLDLVLTSLGGTRVLLNHRERLDPPPATLTVDLQGPPGNPQAIGAELRLFTQAGPEPGRLLQFVVRGLGDPPRGRRPAGPLVLAVPPAAAGGRLRLEVEFPGGHRRSFAGLEAGARVLAEELEAAPTAAPSAAPTAAPSAAISAAPSASAASLAVFREKLAFPGVAVVAAGALALLAAGLARRRDGVAGAAIGPYGDARFLAGGSVGEVYRARDPRGRPVAIKLLHEHLARDPETRARFEREADLLERLDSPLLLRGLGRGLHRGRPYLVAELLEGRTLHQLLEAEGPRPADALAIAAGVAAALEYLHGRGLVHRDVKSDNVFVMNPAGFPTGGWEGRLKLLDLGLARDRALATLTAAGAAVGTLAYLAPEQLAGGGADARSDLWALGLLLAEVYHGRRPTVSPEGYLGGFLSSPGRAPSPERLAELFPEAWQELLRRLLAADPAERFADAATARVALRRLAEPLK